MNKARIAAVQLPAGLPLRLLFAATAILLALLSLPQAGHAQGIVRGAQEAPMKATGSPGLSVAWLAARSAPVLEGPWVRWRACSEFRITAITAAAATMTVTIASTATGEVVP